MLLFYLFLISFMLSYIASNTREKWSSMYCAILIFFVPPFAPPSAYSVNAITLTQLTDSVSLSLNLSKSRLSLSKVLCLVSHKRLLILTLLAAFIGPLIVYALTCVVSVLLVIPSLIVYPILKITNIDSSKIPFYTIISSFIASATGFNQHALRAYLGNISSEPRLRQSIAFVLLLILVAPSGLMNLFLSNLRFGIYPSLYEFLFSASGALSGSVVGGKFVITQFRRNADTLYLVLLEFLGIIGLFQLLPRRL